MNTADRIKNYLSRNNSASVYELSQALDLSKADIHYHIRILVSDGVIAASSPKPTQCPGRPARRFELIEIPPLSITRLVISHLLNEAAAINTKNTQRRNLANRLSEMILSCCPSSLALSYSPAVKLNRIVEELKPLGFQIRWEAGQIGPLIHFDHEPISQLIDDKILVRKILNKLSERILKIAA
jgi:predicted ArsR family transcriptional regulator